MSKAGTATIGAGTTQEPDGNHCGTSGRSGTPHPLKGGGGQNQTRRKFATKQARNREHNRVKKLNRQNTKGCKTPRQEIVSASMLERAAQEMALLRADETRAENERLSSRRQSLAAVQQAERARAELSRQLYRETREARLPQIKQRDEAILAAVKKAVTEADARAFELRHRGRPKGKQGLLLNLHRDPDALIVSVPQWQGER